MSLDYYHEKGLLAQRKRALSTYLSLSLSSTYLILTRFRLYLYTMNYCSNPKTVRAWTDDPYMNLFTFRGQIIIKITYIYYHWNINFNYHYDFKPLIILAFSLNLEMLSTEFVSTKCIWWGFGWANRKWNWSCWWIVGINENQYNKSGWG